MIPLVKEKLPEIESLCRRYPVRRLDLFGSAATGRFDDFSDLDFAVEFDSMTVPEYFDAYFGLLADLQDLMSRNVDLVEVARVKKPAMLASIQSERELIFERSH